MNYSPGKLGMSKAIALTFSTTFPTIFLVTPAAGVEVMGSLGWIMPLFAGLLNIAMIFLLIFVLNRIPGDLFSVTEALLGKTLAKVVGVYYLFMFISIASGWIREFSENTLLTALPAIDFEIVVIWYAVIAALLVYSGIENLCRTAFVTIPFAIFSLFIVYGGLVPRCQLFYLLPWQGNGLETVITPALRLAGENGVIILLVMLAPSFQNLASLGWGAVYGVGISSVLRSFSISVFIMIFGQSVAMEKSLPFYEMARLVYLNRYVQRLEAIFILIWVMAGIFAIAFFLFGAVYTAQKTFKLPTMRPLIPVLTIISIYVSMIPPNLPTTIDFLFKTYLYYNTIGAFVIPTILFLTVLFKGRDKLCHQG